MQSSGTRLATSVRSTELAIVKAKSSTALVAGKRGGLDPGRPAVAVARATPDPGGRYTRSPHGVEVLRWGIRTARAKGV